MQRAEYYRLRAIGRKARSSDRCYNNAPSAALDIEALTRPLMQGPVGVFHPAWTAADKLALKRELRALG